MICPSCGKQIEKKNTLNFVCTCGWVEQIVVQLSATLHGKGRAVKDINYGKR